jgi:hypothetical protein
MKKAINILKCVYWTAMGVTALINVYDTCKEFNKKHKEERINKMKEDCIDIEEAE